MCIFFGLIKLLQYKWRMNKKVTKGEMMVDIRKPTNEEVKKYLKQWEDLKNYVNQENSLNKLFFDSR